MDSPSSPSRPPVYRPALAAFAALACAWAFVLVTLGAFTTSINAGMAFPDWPLSNGSLNPRGWLANLSMFAEHSHRLSGTAMGILTVVLAVWLSRREERAWLRRLGWWAVGMVVLQGVIGGARVLLDPVPVPGFEMSLGRMLRIPHGIIAQAYVCSLIAIAGACSRSWAGRTVPVSGFLKKWGRVCAALVFVQLAIAAVMRHNNAGLAIPTFPWSTPDGGILPAAWSAKVAIHFAHRAMAAVLVAALGGFAVLIWRDRGATLGMRSGASALVSLVALQILLGAAAVRTYRDPAITTSHVLVGALILALTFWLAWTAHRDDIEGPEAA